MVLFDGRRVRGVGLAGQRGVPRMRLVSVPVCSAGQHTLPPPPRPQDSSWSETGDRYCVKLFRDFVFHAAHPDTGGPLLDWGCIVEALNKVRRRASGAACSPRHARHSAVNHCGSLSPLILGCM